MCTGIWFPLFFNIIHWQWWKKIFSTYCLKNEKYVILHSTCTDRLFEFKKANFRETMVMSVGKIIQISKRISWQRSILLHKK